MSEDVNYQAAKIAAEILHDHNFEAYIIGGAVRDLLLGYPPKDYDIATNAKPEELITIKELANPHYTDPAQAYGVTRTRVKVNNELVPIEITTYRRDTKTHLGRKLTEVEFSDIFDDIRRRDFTINALALDPLNLFLIDETNGLQDLENKYIRFIGNAKYRIIEDPLRILRAIRIKCRLGFRYSDSAAEAITAATANGEANQIATDRVRQEFSHMLTAPTREEALQDLESFGLIDQLLPELAHTKGVAQPPEYHSEGDVFTHTKLAIRYLPEKSSERLVWATLLHDIGKAITYTPQEITGDKIRFSDHHSEGATLARQVLERLRFSNKFIDEVTWMIHYHLSTAQLPEMRPGHAQTFMAHSAFGDLLELLRADAHAAWGKQNGELDTSAPDLSTIEQMYEDFLHQPKSKSLKEDLGIDGNWILEQFPEIQKGKQLGQVLTELKLLYSENNLQSEDDAIKAAKNILAKQQHQAD